MLSMKKTGLVLFVIFTIILQPITANALSSGEAKQLWHEAKQVSRDTQAEHRAAKIAWAANKTDENNQKVIQTGKAVLHAALDEVEAWLTWRNIEVEENPEIPQNLKDSIQTDVNTNIQKINALRMEVDEVETQFELAIVFLKMVGKYLELLTDVARNTGLVWIHMADTYSDRIEDYETQLREAAVAFEDNMDIIEKLDLARTELETARTNIENAEDSYLQVVIPGNPLVKFSNGNNYMRLAKNNLLSALSYLNQAYREMVSES
jgi:hypothetical protein